jgi:hypothetical protein
MRGSKRPLFEFSGAMFGRDAMIADWDRVTRRQRRRFSSASTSRASVVARVGIVNMGLEDDALCRSISAVSGVASTPQFFSAHSGVALAARTPRRRRRCRQASCLLSP